MATVPFSKDDGPIANGDASVQKITWSNLANGDDGTPLTDFAAFADRSVQFVATAWGSGGTVILEGSNDGTNYHTLTNLQGTSISKTSISGTLLEQITEACFYTRPRVTAGDGDTDIDIVMMVRRR